MGSDEEKEFNTLFKYYEKAIEGRNFHYKNYNTWANYYSIFTGALFIAFYTLEKENKDFLFLKILIMLVGLVTSICWNLTVKGHYHWMLSWISVVQDYEKKIAKFLKNNKNQKLYVYSVYLNKGENFLNKNISSQKLTSKFTFFISLAWALLLVINLFSLFEKTLCIRTSCFSNSCCNRCLFILLFSMGITALIYLVTYLIFDSSSDVTEMKNNITD